MLIWNNWHINIIENSNNGSLYVSSALDSLSFLDRWICSFHKIWKIFALFIYLDLFYFLSLLPLFSFCYSNDTNIRLLYIDSEITIYPFFPFSFCSSVWIALIVLSTSSLILSSARPNLILSSEIFSTDIISFDSIIFINFWNSFHFPAGISYNFSCCIFVFL